MPKKTPNGSAGSSKVDWKALKTARGSASRVPSLVKALVEGKTLQDRAAAYYTLSQGLYADGVVGPSAAPTVTLLCEVLANRQEGAHRAAWLMGEALTAGHERVLSDTDASIGGAIADVRKAVSAGQDVLLAAL